MNPPNSLLEQVRRHKELTLKVNELEKERKALGVTILEQMRGKVMQIDEYSVKRYTRLNYKVTLDDARTLGATKMEETLDKEKLKALFSQNHDIPGMSEFEYIVIMQTKEEAHL